MQTKNCVYIKLSKQRKKKLIILVRPCNEKFFQHTIIKIISTREKLIQYKLFISMLVFYNSDKICSSKRNPKTYSHSQISNAGFGFLIPSTIILCYEKKALCSFNDLALFTSQKR